MTRLLLPGALVLLALLPPAASAQPLFPFDVPWAAYNTATSMSGGDPVAFAAADFDHDGDPDVVTTRGRSEFGGSGFAFLRNDGRGRLAPSVLYSSVSNTWGIVAADFNGDGDLDVAVSNGNYLMTSGNTVSIFPGNGDGTFAAAQAFSVGAGAVVPVGLAAADFDGDADLDLAVAAYGVVGGGSTVVLLQNDGDGTFAAPVAFPAGDGPYRLVAADLTGDGRPDLVASTEDLGVSVLRNDGSGGFLAPVVYEAAPGSGIRFSAVAVGDVEGDGDLDVFGPGLAVSERGRVLIYRNDGAGVLTQQGSASFPPYTSAPWDIAAGDLNDDDALDLVAAHYTARADDGVVVLLNDGDGTFAEGTKYPGGQATYAVAVADMDEDGALDVLTADDYSMAVTVRLNPGDGVFPTVEKDPTGYGEFALDAADLDGDGDLDAFTSGKGVSTVQGSVLRNDGTGRFGDRQVIAIPFEGVQHGVLRDLNGDGFPDLLFNNLPSNNAPYDFFVALNNGDGTFPQPTRVPVGSCGWGRIDAFDLDGDGDLDVVDMEDGGGPGCSPRFYVAKNNGNGTFATPYAVPLPFRPYGVAGGDFNEDGDLDLAMTAQGAYGYDRDVMVVRGNGDGTFDLPATRYTVARGPFEIVTADLDDDGHLDLAASSTGYDDGAFYIGEEKLTVLFGTGSGTFTRIQTYYAPFSYDLRTAGYVRAGDVDADGDLDLMAETGTNSIALYVNDGNGLFTFPYSLGFTHGANSPFYADFTGDGVPDIAAVAEVPPPIFSSISALAVLPGITGASSAPVAVSVAPVDPPVVIGAGGGSFDFTVTLTNTTDRPQTFQAWSEVTGPIDRNPVIGPRTVTLPAGATVTRTLTQPVPANAPPGTYTYAVNVGTFPGTIAATDGFPVVKQGAALAGTGSDSADSWAASGLDELVAGTASSATTVLPGGFSLSEVSPNPFRGQARVTLSLPEAQAVRVEVFDGVGRRVAVLQDGTLDEGAHALVFDGSAFPAGVYAVRATGETFSATRRATLVR